MYIGIAEVCKSEKKLGAESSIEGVELSIGGGARATPKVYKLTPVATAHTVIRYKVYWRSSALARWLATATWKDFWQQTIEWENIESQNIAKQNNKLSMVKILNGVLNTKNADAQIIVVQTIGRKVPNAN